MIIAAVLTLILLLVQVWMLTLLARAPYGRQTRKGFTKHDK